MIINSDPVSVEFKNNAYGLQILRCAQNDKKLHYQSPNVTEIL